MTIFELVPAIILISAIAVGVRSGGVIGSVIGFVIGLGAALGCRYGWIAFMKKYGEHLKKHNNTQTILFLIAFFMIFIISIGGGLWLTEYLSGLIVN